MHGRKPSQYNKQYRCLHTQPLHWWLLRSLHNVPHEVAQLPLLPNCLRRSHCVLRLFCWEPCHWWGWSQFCSPLRPCWFCKLLALVCHDIWFRHSRCRSTHVAWWLFKQRKYISIYIILFFVELNSELEGNKRLGNWKFIRNQSYQVDTYRFNQRLYFVLETQKWLRFKRS